MPPKDDDEFDLDSFYLTPDSGKEEEEDDGDEYELEPPDEEIIAGEKQRAAETIDIASKSVNIDDLYRDQAAISDEIEAYVKSMRFQFGVKHLLWAMTALAVLFVIAKFVIGSWAALLLVLVFLGLAAAYAWFNWQEQMRLQQWEEKRDELYRQHKERLNQDNVTKHDDPRANEPNDTRLQSFAPEFDTLTFASPPRFAFTTQDLLMLATTTCVMLFAMQRFGFAAGTLVLGLMLAVAGFVSATLPNPPRVLATCAWLLLAFYVVMSFLSILVG